MRRGRILCLNFYAAYSAPQSERDSHLALRAKKFMDKYEALKRCFGYNTFRPGQEEIIDALIEGKDVLAIMPTGSGKSLCYQIPAIVRDGITLVISPLIALMRDQVDALQRAGIPCAYINGTLTPRQIDMTLESAAQGKYKILYVAPERLINSEFKRFVSAAAARIYHRARPNIGTIIVDEAHCISLWGSAFRPSYQRIDEFVASLPNRPVMGAFTATATAAVASDIEKLLGLQNPLCVTTGFDRPNLYFDVRQPEDKLAELSELLRKRRGQCGIVYCLTRSAVDEVSEALRSMGINAARYHGGMGSNERDHAQEEFIRGRAGVIVATNAFGMGIDKPDVRFVIHYNMPLSLESYYQEAGRAGRDGNKSDCILLFSESDISTCKWLIGHSTFGTDMTSEQADEFKQRELQKVDRMAEYCRTSECLRHNILDYFGQQSPEQCGWCSNCIKNSLISKLHGGSLAELLRKRQNQRAEKASDSDKK